MTMPQSPVPPAASAGPTPVTVTALDVPFTRLMGFFFKATLAAIPAVIIAVLLLKVLFGMVSFVIGGWRYGYWTWF